MPENTNEPIITDAELTDEEAARQQLLATLQTTESVELRTKRRSVQRMLDVLEAASRVSQYVTSNRVFNQEAGVYAYDGSLSVEITVYEKNGEEEQYAGRLTIHLATGSTIDYTSTTRSITV